LGQLKLALPLLLLLTISFVSVFAYTSDDISVVSGKAYLIHYEVKDSQVKSVEINKESQSLVFSVQATSSTATLQFTLPLELVDSTKSDDTDDKFIVLADGEPMSEIEKSSSSLARTLLVLLTSGIKEIEIIGTHIGVAPTTSENNTQSMSSTTSTPTTPVEQRPMENKTNQNNPSQPAVLQPTSITSQTKSVQEQILQQITLLLHFKSGYLPLEISKKQIVEYSIIAAIVLIVIIVIASSARSKNKKSIRK
jgi:hypothetical protein